MEGSAKISIQFGITFFSSVQAGYTTLFEEGMSAIHIPHTHIIESLRAVQSSKRKTSHLFEQFQI